MKLQSGSGSWMLTLPVAGLAVAYVYFFFLPGQESLRVLADEVAAKKLYIADSATSLAAIETVGRELAEVRCAVAAWQEQAARGGDFNELFGQTIALAKLAGLATTRFDPQPAEPTEPTEKVERVGVVLGVSGTFAQVGQFLHDVESLPQTIWVDSIHLEQSREVGKGVMCEASLVIFGDNSGNSG